MKSIALVHPRRQRKPDRLRSAGQTQPVRRGLALVEVIIGGVLLAIGLAVIITLNSRALRSQTDGEKQMIAAWLADEKLTMVLVDGPIDYPKLYDTNGRCEPPFDDFEYDIAIEDQGVIEPFRVTATIRWTGAGGDEYVQVQTLISDRGGDPNEQRTPTEPIDREARWYGDEKKGK